MRFNSGGLVVVFFFLCACALPSPTAAGTTADQQAALQAQLDQINKEIAQNQSQLSEEQRKRSSLERDVAILDSQIQGAQLEIKRRDLTIAQIKNSVRQKEVGIVSLDSHVSTGEASVAHILRQTNVIDDTPLAARILGGTLDSFIRELDDFGTVQKALDDSFKKMAIARKDLAARKAALEEEQQGESDLLQLQVAQRNSLKTREKEKQDLVAAAKGTEAVYQKIIAGKQQSAAQIRAALFALTGASRSVSFGDIYNYAKEAGARSGVRPALILGILSEESNLGQNVGTGNWRVDMNQTRDAPLFQQICAALGLNPDSQPVSKKPWYGYGGAMGPAQFIPSTWQLYSDRIAAMTGQDPPNPWDPRTATFAAALLLQDNGADAQTAGAERLAALRYLAGWKNAGKSAYAFYGDDVMALTAKFQSQIDILGS
ncbi:MAG TPA: lytic murein transglycosylase [Candidatus Paceibacterota bacterium]